MNERAKNDIYDLESTMWKTALHIMYDNPDKFYCFSICHNIPDKIAKQVVQSKN